jgi:hypothetical protein
MACYNDAAAQNCIYSLPRGGKPIIGPSIGFANIVAQAWGNCTDGARIVHIDRKEKVIVAEGGFHDLETNRKTMLPVQRRICGKDGRLFNDDMIMVTGMAAASIARRNAILNAVPRALWFPIFEEALQIVRGSLETFAESKDKALKAFAQFGVAPDKVIMALGLKGDADLTLEHITPLRGMYQALRDGSVTVEEMFDPRRMTGTGFEKVDNPLGDETAPAETVDPKTGEIKTASAKPQPGDVDYNNLSIPAANELKEKRRGRPAKTETPPAAASPLQVNPPLKEQGEPAPAALQPTSSGPRPRSSPEYKAYMENWLAGYTKIADIEDRWRQDRTLRGECGVVEEVFASLRMLKEARVAQLQKAGQ